MPSAGTIAMTAMIAVMMPTTATLAISSVVIVSSPFLYVLYYICIPMMAQMIAIMGMSPMMYMVTMIMLAMLSRSLFLIVSSPFLGSVCPSTCLASIISYHIPDASARRLCQIDEQISCYVKSIAKLRLNEAGRHIIAYCQAD